MSHECYRVMFPIHFALTIDARKETRLKGIRLHVKSCESEYRRASRKHCLSIIVILQLKDCGYSELCRLRRFMDVFSQIVTKVSSDTKTTRISILSKKSFIGLKREESVRAKQHLIFVTVVEDCLARAIVADLWPEQ